MDLKWSGAYFCCSNNFHSSMAYLRPPLCPAPRSLWPRPLLLTVVTVVTHQQMPFTCLFDSIRLFHCYPVECKYMTYWETEKLSGGFSIAKTSADPTMQCCAGTRPSGCLWVLIPTIPVLFIIKTDSFFPIRTVFRVHELDLTLLSTSQ